MIRMVREPSETPNISNIDDIIAMRYAYGGQDGYVVNKGEEIDAVVNGKTITIGSGRIVLQGVESDIDVNGVLFNIDSLNLDRFYVIYYEVNLGANKTSLQISPYSTTGIPEIDAGDDLTRTPSGTARLPLYNVLVNNNVVSVEKIVKPVNYTGDMVVKKAQYAEKLFIDGKEENPTRKKIWSGDELSASGYNFLWELVFNSVPLKEGKTYEFVGTFTRLADLGTTGGWGIDTPFRFKVSLGKSYTTSASCDVFMIANTLCRAVMQKETINHTYAILDIRPYNSNDSMGKDYTFTLKYIYELVD